MIQEIKQRSEEIPDFQMETLYLGGGTPSVLQAHQIELLINTVRDYYSPISDMEMTIEANPEDVSKDVLNSWIDLGINRISLGVQSLVDEHLQWMNRTHSVSDSLHALELISDSPISNYSCDLIYGIPSCTDEMWEAQLKTITDLKIPHLSCYALTVEPKTHLSHLVRKRKLQLPGDEHVSLQMLKMLHHLRNNNYEDYEISNFALRSYRSKHNSSYWEGKPYLGIGPSAHSYHGDIRRWNISNNITYVQAISKGNPYWETEVLSEKSKYNEYLMLQIRRIEGVDRELLHQKFPQYSNVAEEIFKKHMIMNLLNFKEGRYVLTDQGKLFADRIAMEAFIA